MDNNSYFLPGRAENDKKLLEREKTHRRAPHRPNRDSPNAKAISEDKGWFRLSPEYNLLCSEAGTIKTHETTRRQNHIIVAARERQAMSAARKPRGHDPRPTPQTDKKKQKKTEKQKNLDPGNPPDRPPKKRKKKNKNTFWTIPSFFLTYVRSKTH